jgi:DNA replication protein DnaC
VRSFARMSGLGPEHLEQSFQSWDNEKQPNPRHAATLAEAFGRWAAEQSGDVARWYPWLVVMGGTGIGKTHLCRAAMWRLARRNQWSTYITGPQLGDAVRDFDSDAPRNIKATMIEAHWLIIDDVGSAHDPTRYVAGIVQDVLNQRFDRRAPTLLTSNKVGEALKEHVDRDDTGRTWDRLNDLYVSEVIDASALVSVRGRDGGQE